MKEDKNKSGLLKIGAVILLLALLLAASVTFGMQLRKNHKNLSDNNTETASDSDVTNENTIEVPEETTTEAPPEESSGQEDIAIFGVDTRAKNLGKGTRSDSLMIAHIDHDKKEVRIMSIYRDCMVHIEDHGYEKITHAHSYGGPDLAIQTLNENFDLSIENYLTVNFINVADLVDSLGGIDHDITESEAKYINTYIDEINRIRKTDSAHITEAGNYTLDGTQAVAYTRIRYTAGGDYRRAERQRDMLFCIFSKAKDLGRVTRLKLASDLLDQISTNLQSEEITRVLYYLSGYEIVDTDAFPKVFYGGKIEGAWVEVPITLTDMVRGIHEFLYDSEDYEPSERVQEYSNVLHGKASTPNENMSDD